MLTILEHIPDGLLSCQARDLHRILPGPTLLHLAGRRPEPLFVSVLLHGNETTGLTAVQELLRDYRGKELPRALSIFFGNVAAAAEGLRHLPGQPDYNRVWPHAAAEGDSPEQRMMQEILAQMRERGVFASIDIHNNTGLNPHYGCVNRLDNGFLHLAAQFSRTVVYFIRPQGVQSMAFAELCPAVTVECGKPDQPHGAEHAREFMDACLNMAALPQHPVAAHDIALYHTVATVNLPAAVSAGFGDGDWDLSLPPDLDHLNFRELAPGTAIGWVRDGLGRQPLEVTDEHGQCVAERYLSLDEGEIRTSRQVMPSMFTLDLDIIRQDCLGYLMERMSLADSPATS